MMADETVEALPDRQALQRFEENRAQYDAPETLDMAACFCRYRSRRPAIARGAE